MAKSNISPFPDAHKQTLKEWEEAAAQLQIWKNKEMELRKAIVAAVSDKTKSKGTENFDLGGGFKVTMVKSQNYKLDKDKVNDALDKIEAMGPEGKVYSDRLVKFEPKLSFTEYDSLPAKYKEIIDEVITVSDATPTVEIVVPKTNQQL